MESYYFLISGPFFELTAIYFRMQGVGSIWADQHTF